MALSDLAWTCHARDHCESTQDELRDLLLNHSDQDLIAVQALRQDVGRGRHGRRWIMSDGDLAFSFSLKPARAMAEWGSLGLLVGLALYRAVSVLNAGDVRLKWPNDMLLGGRKCAGILCEIEGDYLLVGMGVNLVARAQDGPFAALDIGLDAGGLMERILQEVRRLMPLWEAGGFAALMKDWSAAALSEGTLLSVKCGDVVHQGFFVGVNESGALLLQVEGAMRIITSGEVIGGFK